MPIRETSALTRARPQPPMPEQSHTVVSEESAQRQQNAPAQAAVKSSSALANHKGKLAIGAAAMLGLAVFYKWRDSKLAKENPEEYARLRRLRAAMDGDEAKAKKGR